MMKEWYVLKRLRNKFIKKENLRYISHLDLMRTIERALRRADINVAFSNGFNPHPKISFGPALMVGATTHGDYFDIDIEDKLSPDEFKERMNRVLPEGIEITDSFQVNDKDLLSLHIKEAEYVLKVKLFNEIDKINEKIDSFISNDIIEIVKKSKKGKKTINIKPYILNLSLIGFSENWLELYIKLKLCEGAPNPLHVLKALNDYLGFKLDLDTYILDRKNIILN